MVAQVRTICENVWTRARTLTAGGQISQGISYLDDVQQFYRERAVIEQEYAGKLSALAKKYFEKKAKKSSVLSVGETPVVTPGSLERYAGSLRMVAWATTYQEKQRDDVYMEYPAHNTGTTSRRARSLL